MNIQITLLAGAILLALSGCSQKVGIKALEPAEIDRVSMTKKLAVTNFTNDKVGLSRKIEANLAKFKIHNKKYFTMLSRNDFDTIIREQKIQNSGLIEQSTAVEVGQLIGAQAIISGNVGSVTSQDSYFYEKRVKCADKKCKRLVEYSVKCKKKVVGLSSEIRIVDIKQGDIIFADTLNKTKVYKHCSDDSYPLPSTEIAAQKIAGVMAREFAFRLTPHYRYFNVTLLEEPDLKYNNHQEELLEVALEYIEQSRYDKAQLFLTRLIDSTSSQSYVAFYNLGVIKEAQGNYDEAKEYYGYADNLMVKPVSEISEAVVRIERLMEKRKQTRVQLSR